jgi:iron complex transport system ATP-binding protein
MVVHLKDVSWICDSKQILRDINWEVTYGEHWAIIGLNGAGKTSLLNMINGYIWPSKGEIIVLGRKFGNCDVRELRRSIGWVSSSLQEKFYASETAEEIVLSVKYATIGLYDKPKPGDVDRAVHLLKQFRCGHVAKQPYLTLSQGEKQKVLIARALMHSPRLLILDEPCAGLDMFAREQVLSLMEDIARLKTAPTLLYVSHHIEEILPIFTHTLLMRKGHIYSQGITREVLTKRNMSDFLEMPVDIRWCNGRAWMMV